MPAEPAPSHFTRLLAILAYLDQHGQARIAELAEHFGVSTKQIRTDLNTLWVSGLPGGLPDELIDFSIDDSWDHVSLAEGLGLEHPLRLTPREVISLLVGLAHLRQDVQQESLITHIDTLVQQLRDLLPTASVQTVEQEPWEDVLRQAIRQHCPVAITYVNYDDVRSERVIDPYGLVERNGVLYVNAYCHSARDRRQFRLDRIMHARLTDGTWHPSPASDRCSQAIPVQLRADRSLRWLLEEYDATITTSDAQFLECEIEFFSRERMVRTILAAADRIEQVDGPGVAQMVASRAHAALERMDSVISHMSQTGQ